MVGYKVLAACDFLGEKLAYFFGITTPKFNYEIEQFKKMQKERQHAEEEEKTMGGWMQDAARVHSQQAEPKTKNEPQPPIMSQDGLQKF